MQEGKSLKKPHQLVMEERNKLYLSGVQDVDCFDESVVVLFTNLGKLVVRGKNLHVNSFNVAEGEFSMEGEIGSLQYADEEKTGGLSFLSRLFK